ncbi:hypothetical protein DOY81_013337, partial [Sarcophaga bullata]
VLNAYDGPECDEAEQNISIILNGIESELKFIINARDVKNRRVAIPYGFFLP